MSDQHGHWVVGPRVTVPARHHVDPVLDALDRLVDWASWRIDRPSVELIAATVRDALERHREERDAAENRYQRATEDIGRLMARDQRLTEGLRELERLLRWALNYIFIDWERSWQDEPSAVTEARALLSANPPQGDAADFCEHGYTTEDSAHPSAGLERCPTCSPSDGGGAK